MHFLRTLSVVGNAKPISDLRHKYRNIAASRAVFHAAFTPALYAVLRGPTAVRLLAGAASEQTESPEHSPETQTTTNKTESGSSLQLQLNTGGFIIPHPQKVAKGGEDAFFIATNQRSFGVADGVGGWADAGVDPGNFSRNLMREARKAAEVSSKKGDGSLDSFQILCTALKNSEHITGSSTACILCLNGDTLIASNIGDSGFLILRDGRLLTATPPQQHRFNFPYQIGTKGNSVTAAQNFICKLKPGDIIVAGTDGLFDNVFTHRATKLLWDAKKHGALPGVAAQQLATFASARSMDPVYQSPFAKAASQAGFYYRGGKVDDITVVVSYVTGGKVGEDPIGAGASSDTTASASSVVSDATNLGVPDTADSGGSGQPQAVQNGTKSKL